MYDSKEKRRNTMSIKTSGTLKIECNECHTQHNLSASDFDWDCVETNTRQMGSENNYEASSDITCECGNEINVKINAWEYPEGVFNTDDYSIDGGKIIQKIDIKF